MTEPKPCPFCGERLKYEERVCRALRAGGARCLLETLDAQEVRLLRVSV